MLKTEPVPENRISLQDDGAFTTFDEKTFPSLKWTTEGASPQLVVIGVHGINGAAEDWDVLGEFLRKERPEYALYAYNLRGMGRDPVEADRGDILKVQDWVEDLAGFDRLVRQKHPKAKIVWFGESLGSLIVMRALDTLPAAAVSDGVALSAPITGIDEKISVMRQFLLRSWAFVFPRWRVSLESLGDGGKVEVVEGVDHTAQANTNEWHVRQHSLRLLVTIGHEAKQMPERASRLQIPSLILHGGKDIFTSDRAAQNFAAAVPKSSGSEFYSYPESYHLLFYGANRENVCRDVAQWLDQVARLGAK